MYRYTKCRVRVFAGKTADSSFFLSIFLSFFFVFVVVVVASVLLVTSFSVSDCHYTSCTSVSDNWIMANPPNSHFLLRDPLGDFFWLSFFFFFFFFSGRKSFFYFQLSSWFIAPGRWYFDKVTGCTGFPFFLTDCHAERTCLRSLFTVMDYCVQRQWFISAEPAQ